MAFDTHNSLDLYTRVFDLWKQSTETPTAVKGHQRELWNVDEWQLNSLLYNHCPAVSLVHLSQEGTLRLIFNSWTCEVTAETQSMEDTLG